METFGITFGIAFLAGVATFFTPCILPVLPGFFTFLGRNAAEKKRMYMFFSTLVFLFGFLLVLTLLGIGANILGKPLAMHRRIAEILGGIFLLFLALQTLGVFRFSFLLQEHRFPAIKTSSHILHNFLFGVVFGFAWTPCIGPVLGTLLFLATQEKNANGDGTQGWYGEYDGRNAGEYGQKRSITWRRKTYG